MFAHKPLMAVHLGLKTSYQLILVAVFIFSSNHYYFNFKEMVMMKVPNVLPQQKYPLSYGLGEVKYIIKLNLYAFKTLKFVYS